MSWVWGRRDGRAGFAVLAMLALFLQLAAPQGFMLARDAGRPTIVICTGHGPLLAPVDDHGVPAKAPKSKPGAMCAFAGHGGAPTPTPVPVLAAIRFAPLTTLAPSTLSATPGRGLAAPPPPSQGPPTHLL
jgi:hypothetical protein